MGFFILRAVAATSWLGFSKKNQQAKPVRGDKVSPSQRGRAPINEKQTKIDLINPPIFERDWIEILIREEKTLSRADIIDGRVIRNEFCCLCGAKRGMIK